MGDARAWPVPDGIAQLVVTDPPYNSLMPYDLHVDEMPWDEYWTLLEQFIAEAVRVLRNQGLLAVLFPSHVFPRESTTRPGRGRGTRAADPPRMERRRVGSAVRMAGRLEAMIEEAGLLYEGTLTVVHGFNGDKFPDAMAVGTGVGSPSRPFFRMASRSLVLAFKGRAVVPGRNGRFGGLPLDWCKTTWVVRPAWASGRKYPHPCPMPYEVASRVIQVFSNPGDLVVDPFNGSGITLRAAKDLGRAGIGFDLSPYYGRLALERLRQEVLEGV